MSHTKSTILQIIKICVKLSQGSWSVREVWKIGLGYSKGLVFNFDLKVINWKVIALTSK